MYGTVDRTHFDPPSARTNICASKEVEISPARVERGRDGVAHAIGDLVRLAVSQCVEHDDAQVTVQSLGIREPARVRRPHRRKGPARLSVRVGIDFGGLPRRDIHNPQIQMIVGEHQVLSVRRPFEAGEVTRRRKRDDAGSSESILITNHQLVLAARIGEPRDSRTVRRPSRIAIMRPGTAREIAHIPLLRGYREDVAARLKDSANAGWRQRGRVDHAGDRPHLVAGPGCVAVHIDGEPSHLIAGDIIYMDVARLLEHDSVGSGTRIHDVGIGEVRELADYLRVDAVRIEIRNAITIRDEVNRVADPHWLVVVAVRPRQLLHRMAGQINNRHRMRTATAVPAPKTSFIPRRDELLHDFVIG